MDKKLLKCPLCGKEFTEEEAMKGCPASCGRNCTSCGQLSCPNCGYKMPGESKTVAWIEGIISKFTKREKNQ